MGTRNFSDFLVGFHEYCKNHDSPHIYKDWSALSIVAGALERKVWCSNGFITTYPNLYIFIIGDRGVGKSVMTSVAMRLLEEVPGVSLAANKINDASLIKKMIKVGHSKGFELNGTTYKNSSVFIYASEASSTFKEMYPGSSIITTLTDLYNCNDEPWTNIPKWKKDTMKDDEVAVHNPCINLLACSTPSWLMSKVMTKGDIEGGFGSRCIMVVHKGNFEFKRGWHLGSMEDATLREKLVQDLRAIAALRGVYTVTDDWRAEHAKYQKKHNERMIELDKVDPIMAAVLARKTSTFLMKISMVLAASESDDMEINGTHCIRAWTMLNRLEKDMAYAFKSFAVSEEVAHVQDIKRYLLESKQEVFSYGEMMDVFQNKYNGRRVREALADLISMGFIGLDPAMGTGYFHLKSSERGQQARLPELSEQLGHRYGGEQ